MVVTAAIIGIMFVGLSRIFHQLTTGFSSLVAGNSLKSAGQEAVNRVGRSVAQGYRLYQESDLACPGGFWCGRLPAVLTPGASTDSPSAGSRLPAINSSAVLSPWSSSLSGIVGNSLFFSRLETSMDFVDPVTGRSVLVDFYRFYYYYVASNPAIQIAGQPQLVLKEWRSETYADYPDLISVPPGPFRAQILDGVLTRTQLAWDPTQPVYADAFFQISGGGGALAPRANHVLRALGGGGPSNAIRNIYPPPMSGHKTGISPNGVAGVRHTVPRFASASGSFPGGFEVMIVGPSSGRTVFFRMVLIARGAFKGHVTSEQIQLRTVRDVW